MTIEEVREKMELATFDIETIGIVEVWVEHYGQLLVKLKQDQFVTCYVIEGDYVIRRTFNRDYIITCE